MALDPRLLEILVCPQDRQPMFYFADEGLLFNPRLKCTYVVDANDIPHLIVDEATTVSDVEHDRLAAIAESDELVPTGRPSPPNDPTD